MISPSRSRPIEMAKCGTPCRKLVVPSSGSTIQRLRPSPLVSPPSSPRKPYSGRVRASSARSVRSALMSAWLTKSPGPFSETCSCSTSPKSRFRFLAAAKAARIITVMVAERTARDRRSGGPARSRPGAMGARPTRATGLVRSGGRRSVGTATVRSVLRAFHVAAGLGDGEDDGLGQLGAHGGAFIERHHHFHAVLQEAGLVGVENVGADGELLEGLLVHERMAVLVLEQVGALALVDMDTFDGFARAKALLQLVALAQRLGLDGDERTALARADVLDLGGHPELAVVFDDVAGTDGIDGNFHGITGGLPLDRNEWNSASPAGAGRGRRRLLSKAANGRNRASQAQYRLLLPGQVGGDDGVGAFDVGPGLGRRQDPGIVERHPLGACQIGRRTEARRMRQRLIVLRRALEADAADRMIGRRNQTEHLAADLEDYNAFPLHGPCRGRQRAAERVDLLPR